VPRYFRGPLKCICNFLNFDRNTYFIVGNLVILSCGLTFYHLEVVYGTPMTNVVSNGLYFLEVLYRASKKCCTGAQYLMWGTYRHNITYL